jgi:Protein O-mannosyl-transferase TMEM260-like
MPMAQGCEADGRTGGATEGARSPAQPFDGPRPWRSASLVTGAVALAVYGMTLLPGVASFDIAENQTVPRILGIMHATGYPLWTLLGFLWSHLPVGSVALRMNLLSAVLFAAASALASVLVTRLGVRPPLAASAGLVFAFAGGTWTNAVHAEVQSLHVFLLAALLVAWVDAELTESRQSIVVMCLAAGLGMAHHGIMRITAMPLLVWYVVRHLRALRRPRVIPLSLAALGLPSLLYLYLPIAYHLGAPVVNSDLSEGGWLGVIAGNGFRGTIGTLGSLGIWGNKLGDALNGIERSTGLVVVLLAIGGAVVLARRAPGALAGFALVVAAATYAFANGTDVSLRYLVSPLVVVAVLVGVFAERCAAWLDGAAAPRARPYAVAGLAAALALLPASALVSGYRLHDQSGNHEDERNARAILNALPAHAVILAYWDVRTSLQYERFVAGLRPDVTVLDERSSRAIAVSTVCTYDELAQAAARVPDLRGRPPFFIPPPWQALGRGRTYELRPRLVVERPWGLNRLEPGWLYEVVPLADVAPAQPVAGRPTAKGADNAWGDFSEARRRPGWEALRSGASFAGAFVLEGALRRREANDRVVYRLLWRKTAAVPGVWHFFHHFVDASGRYLDGRNVDAGASAVPVGGAFSYEFTIPAGLAASAMRVGLFSPSAPALRIPCGDSTFATIPPPE